MRDLETVLCSIIAIAPDLENEFASIRESIKYAPPEGMYLWWGQAGEVLGEYAEEHEKRDEIAAIWSGQS